MSPRAGATVNDLVPSPTLARRQEPRGDAFHPKTKKELDIKISRNGRAPAPNRLPLLETDEDTQQKGGRAHSRGGVGWGHPHPSGSPLHRNDTEDQLISEEWTENGERGQKRQRQIKEGNRPSSPPAAPKNTPAEKGLAYHACIKISIRSRNRQSH